MHCFADKQRVHPVCSELQLMQVAPFFLRKYPAAQKIQLEGEVESQ